MAGTELDKPNRPLVGLVVNYAVILRRESACASARTRIGLARREEERVDVVVHGRAQTGRELPQNQAQLVERLDLDLHSAPPASMARRKVSIRIRHIARRP